MQLSPPLPGNARVVVVGLGVNRQEPVGSIAGSLSWLQPLAIVINVNNATAHSRDTGGDCEFVVTAKVATGRMDIRRRQGIPQDHGNLRRCETRVRVGQSLSVEPYHADCADDAKRQHLLLPKRNNGCAFLMNGSPVVFVLDDDFSQSENTVLPARPAHQSLSI
jgi:hypothetical protein